MRTLRAESPAFSPPFPTAIQTCRAVGGAELTSSRPHHHHRGLSLAYTLLAGVFPRSEAEDLVLHLAYSPRLLVAQSIEVLLAGVEHWRRAAHEDLDVVGGARQLLLDSLLCDESDAAGPTVVGRIVEEVGYLEAVRVLSGQQVELVSEQDILVVDVCVDEVDLGRVFDILKGGADDLKARREAGSACNHPDPLSHLRVVSHLAFGTSDLDGLADLNALEVLGDVALRVGLDDEVEEAFVVVGGRRGVGSHDVLAINLCLDGDVLADG